VFTQNYAANDSRSSRPGSATVSKLGHAGAGHTEWIFEAIQDLRSASNVERIGVWLNENGNGTSGHIEDHPAIFRGEVWDQGIGGVLEWNRIKIDFPLPAGSLKNGLSCEYEISEPASGPVFGPQLQLRRVLWVPVIVRRTLRGLVMAGSPNKQKPLPCVNAERVARQLELLLELEDERRLAAGRKADMDFWLRLKRLLAERQSTNMILAQLAESCTRGEAVGGAGAVFALIGEYKSGPAPGLKLQPLQAGSSDHLEIRAQSGDAAWAHSVNAGPLEAVWRQAFSEGRPAIVEADPLPLAKEISRFVAVPVEVENELTAVLLAGLPKKRATLDTLDRLSWRSALATEAFEQERRQQAQLQHQLDRKASLQLAAESPALARVHHEWEALQQGIEWLEEGLAVFDENDRIVARNAMFLQLLGLREGEGRKLLNLDDMIRAAAKNAAEPKQFAADWRALAQDCQCATQEELPMLRPIAQSIERYSRPIVNPAGKKCGRVEVYRGVPALRKFQSKMAQTENLASLGQRVTHIVHELNNPLTAILGNAQRLLRQENGDAGPPEVSQILREAERASRMVRELLNIPREGKHEMRLLSLAELVESTVELQSSVSAGSSIHLKTELQESVPRVKGDFAQLQQALLNLLQNAQQAMLDSGVGRTLTVRVACGTAGQVRLEVQDDGPGIPEAIQSRIFDAFFTTKPPGKGTGLGLAIVSGVVKEHRGTIRVFSEPKKGARFVMELPAAEEDEQLVHTSQWSTMPADSAPGTNEASSVANGRKVPRVLVIEDEPTVAALIGDVLREAGMEVDVLTDGAKAVDQAQRCSYDLAVCDVRMPEMDGPQFFAALEEAHSPLREHILFVTGDGIAPRTHDFLVQHRLPYLAKPFRVEELCHAVNQLLSTPARLGEQCGERCMETGLGTEVIDEGHSVSTD
jgi:signal transduction histidine kinase/ActR/RegA family two-component response regulator